MEAYLRATTPFISGLLVVLKVSRLIIVPSSKRGLVVRPSVIETLYKSCETPKVWCGFKHVYTVLVRRPSCGEGHPLVNTLATEAPEQVGVTLSRRVLQRGLRGSFALPIPREKSLVPFTF